MKVSLIAMLLLCLSTTIFFAQEESQTKRSEFGISVGANVMTLNVKTSELLLDQGYKTELKPGFSLGVMYRYRISNLFVLRTQAELSFSETKLYHDSEIMLFARHREMVNIELPVHLMFEKNNKKMAPSVFIGGRYRYDAGVEKIIATDENGVEIGVASIFPRNDVLLDVGFGMAFKMERFSFKPELVYSRGLLNQAGEFDWGFKNIYNNQFGLRFLFYGS